MGVVNTKSLEILNMEAVPIVADDARSYSGLVRRYLTTLEVAAADSDTSTYRFVRLKSNSIVTAVRVYCDAITDGTSFDFGLYYETNKLAGVVVPNMVAMWGSAIDLSTAIGATGPLNITYEATAGNIDAIKKRLWELAALTVDPDCFFDIVATANTVGSAAGTISLEVDVMAGG
jgi:hypothetical protein